MKVEEKISMALNILRQFKDIDESIGKSCREEMPEINELSDVDKAKDFVNLYYGNFASYSSSYSDIMEGIYRKKYELLLR